MSAPVDKKEKSKDEHPNTDDLFDDANENTSLGWINKILLYFVSRFNRMEFHYPWFIEWENMFIIQNDKFKST